jgi:hypothetical protein
LHPTLHKNRLKSQLFVDFGVAKEFKLILFPFEFRPKLSGGQPKTVFADSLQ